VQIRPEQLEAHLARGLKALYTVHGDEPLLAQEAADAIRAAARAAGYGERKVFTVSGAHFDWAGVLGAAQSMSLFAERQLIEIRIPGGKPGKEGSEALQRYCEQISEDVLTIVHLPALDWQQAKSAWVAALDAAGVMLRVETLSRAALPAWLAQRLSRQGQRVKSGEEGQQTLAFLADRTEGNLLAAHQELAKLALLHGEGELAFEQVQAAVLNVARYDLAKLTDAVWAGHTPRALRVLAGLRAEGEAPVRVHWSLAADVQALARAHAALAAGKPMPLALKEAGLWGAREKLLQRVLPLVAEHQVAHLLEAAAVIDGIAKGLKHPDWPHEPWEAIERWVLMMLQLSLPARSKARLALRG
jgi:DNA polymerase III subunit delta